MKFTNPLAAAAAWAERMSDPGAAAERKQRESEERRSKEAEQPPVPEAETAAEAAPVPEAPKTEKKPRQYGDEFRSAVWAGCILLGVACSVVAFFIGTIR